MRPARGFLLWTAVTLLAIGVLRGIIVSFLVGAHLPVAVRLIAANVLITEIWLPVAAVVAVIISSKLPPWQRAALLVVAAFASVIIEPWLLSAARFTNASLPPFNRLVLNRSDTNLLFFIAIVGVAWAVAARRRQIASELVAARIQTALADAQLQVLTLQLHPHFLFNALNLISQLAYESVEAAQRAIANLRALFIESMRHAVHREVSLEEELRFLGAYLEIQQARFRDRLRVTIVASPEVRRAAVPHLVLQPLVENAIAHGLSPRGTAGHLTVTARRADTRLIISIADDGVGVSEPISDGMGITNTRLRLEQLFGADYRFTIDGASPRGTVVTLDVPYRLASTTADDASDISAAESAHADADTPGMLTRVPGWLQVLAGWAAVAMLWTELAFTTPGSASPAFDRTGIVVGYVINAGLWVLLTPLVVRLARRFEVDRMRPVRVLLVHGPLAIVVAVVHTGVWLSILWLLASRQFTQQLRSMFGWAMWDIVAYAAIVAFATIVAFAARFRDVRVTMARARARLASARVATMRLRLQPAVLLAALDSLARVIVLDAERSEATTARIGDLLRMLLSRSDREIVSVDEELDLLQAYLDVVNAPTDESHMAIQSSFDVNAGDQPIPAMLLPTLAAAMAGDVEIDRLELRNDRLHIRIQSGDHPVNQAALEECRERLRGLYDGRERFSVREDNGRTVVDVELPTVSADHAAYEPADARYDLATA